MMIYVYLIDALWILATLIGLWINMRVWKEAYADLQWIRAHGINSRDERDALAVVWQEQIHIALQLIALAGGLMRAWLAIYPSFPRTAILRYLVALVVVMVWSVLLSWSGIRNLQLRRVQQREHVIEEKDSEARRTGTMKTRSGDEP